MRWSSAIQRFGMTVVLTVGWSLSTAEDRLLITRTGSQASTAVPAENFTGQARVEPLFDKAAPSRMEGGSVTFEARARTDWHTHEFAQVLIVVAGAGRVQKWGGPVQQIRNGDIIQIPPRTKHWHGAGPDGPMTHISVVERPDAGSGTTWLEPVTDEQYGDMPAESGSAAADVLQPSRAQQLMGDIAPQLAEITDDVLYGQVWADPALSSRDRSLITVSALIALNREAQLRSHLGLALRNGVHRTELVAAITHLAFYSGWPNAVSAVSIAREVFDEEQQLGHER